jgi:uncharacterized membrane protein YeiH
MTASPLDFGVIAPWLDVAGISLFAASGALAAAQRRLTILSLMFFAAVTGTGGGTVRDLLIGVPVFWIHDPRPLAACLIVALLVWVTPSRVWRPNALNWFDAVGMAAYSVYGAAKALSFGIAPLPAAVMGVVTGCMGGILRDVLVGAPSILLRPELYVTAAALAAGSFAILTYFGMAAPLAAAIAVLAGFGLRALAIVKGLSLPPYRG